jgi:hypothetical protein
MTQVKVPRSGLGNSSELGPRGGGECVSAKWTLFGASSVVVSDSDTGECSSPWHSALRYDMRTILIPGRKNLPVGLARSRPSGCAFFSLSVQVLTNRRENRRKSLRQEPKRRNNLRSCQLRITLAYFITTYFVSSYTTSTKHFPLGTTFASRRLTI